MSNLRVIYNNVADTATITASNTAAGSNIANVKTDFKGQVHRSTGNTVIYNLTWGVDKDQTIGGVILPATNLSSLATIKVEAFSNATWTAPALNSTVTAISACTDTSLAEWRRNGTAEASLNANLFPYGGLSKTSFWFTQQYTNVESLRITLTDTNPAGYIDCARIVCGAYWQPVYGADRSGLNLSITDTSTVNRTDNGDLLPEQGFVYDELSFNLGTLADVDRNTLTDIMRRYATTKNVAVSVFPGNNNDKQEQMYTIYGKRENSSIEYNFPGFGITQIKITGW